MENVSHILGWAWHIQGLSYSTKVLWALEGERDKRRRIRINAITLHQACLFRWFLSRWRGRSNGHISYKLSINVTDVGLTLDCRITHFYGSCGLLSKHNRDGGRPGLIAPSAPTLTRSLSLWGGSDVQTQSVDTRHSPELRFLFHPKWRRTPNVWDLLGLVSFALRSVNEERLLRFTWNKLYLVASKYGHMQIGPMQILWSDLTNGTCSGKQIWFPHCCRSSRSHPSLAYAALISCSIPSLTTHTWTNKSPTSVLQFGLFGK